MSPVRVLPTEGMRFPGLYGLLSVSAPFAFGLVRLTVDKLYAVSTPLRGVVFSPELSLLYYVHSIL